MAIVKSYVSLSIIAGLIGLPGADCLAQNFPAKVIRLLVPGSPGSGQDVLSRIVTPGLGQVLGQQVIVDNRPGASGAIGAEIAAKAPADGYTVLVINIAHALNVSLSRKLPYDLMRDFAPVTQLALSPNMVVVHPSVPVKSVRDLIRFAKARPGAINYSSAGPGSSTFIAAELFKALTGIDIVHVPYNGGGPAVTAVVSGEVSVYFAPLATATPFVRQGRLRALAVTTARRSPAVPELATIAEAGVTGYEYSNWYGLVVPANTPRDTIATIRNAVASVLKRPDVVKNIGDLGGVPVGDQPEEFAAYIRSQIATLAKLFQQNRLGPV